MPKHPSNRVESAGEIAKVIRSMPVFKDPMTVEQRMKNENELMNTYQKRPGDLNDYQKEKAMELIHKRETRLENARTYEKAWRERNKELMNTYLERPGDLDGCQKEKAMELIHKRETRLENGRKYEKARHERNKELMNTYLEHRQMITRVMPQASG
jgi:hypothetical protein